MERGVDLGPAVAQFPMEARRRAACQASMRFRAGRSISGLFHWLLEPGTGRRSGRLTVRPGPPLLSPGHFELHERSRARIAEVDRLRPHRERGAASSICTSDCSVLTKSQSNTLSSPWRSCSVCTSGQETGRSGPKMTLPASPPSAILALMKSRSRIQSLQKTLQPTLRHGEENGDD